MIGSEGNETGRNGGVGERAMEASLRRFGASIVTTISKRVYEIVGESGHLPRARAGVEGLVCVTVIYN